MPIPEIVQLYLVDHVANDMLSAEEQAALISLVKADEDSLEETLFEDTPESELVQKGRPLLEAVATEMQNSLGAPEASEDLDLQASLKEGLAYLLEQGIPIEGS